MAFRIAVICTQYFPFSHADVIVTRWLEQVPNDARLGFVPCTQIASLWVMQHPAAGGRMPVDYNISPNQREVKFDTNYDISQTVARRYGVPIFNSIREALTLGTGALAVDAVLLIGEHGDFPTNEYGQKLYPRKALFDEIVSILLELGATVPVFNDKHLSWNGAWAQEMVDVAKMRGLPLFAGSSVPISGTRHELDLDGEDLAESLGLFHAGGEVYGIHSIEFLQSLVEKRQGGERGIRAIRTYAGADVWAALDRGECSAELFEATLVAAVTAKPGHYRDNCAQSQLKPVMLICEHVDGHKQVHLMLDGHLEEFVAGVKLRSSECRASTANMAGLENFVVNFAHLDREIQKFFLTRQAPIAIERVLLATKLMAAFVHALKDAPGVRVPTPELQIAYRALPYLPVRVL